MDCKDSLYYIYETENNNEFDIKEVKRVFMDIDLSYGRSKNQIGWVRRQNFWWRVYDKLTLTSFLNSIICKGGFITAPDGSDVAYNPIEVLRPYLFSWDKGGPLYRNDN
ncbi:hypothetical protein SU32_05295 [Ahrensia marina]|uniref:Uncharacterized protein n=1 Tax=Ahrensia marina TaxID=1514904 RepID=A0A0N0VLW5_9HYPH|nr:hypothetical protein SU32_05295 [Ahrensia marina]